MRRKRNHTDATDQAFADAENGNTESHNTVQEVLDHPDTKADAPKVKSIVPSKYAGKYKDKTGNALSMFIEGQCTSEATNDQGAVVARTFDFGKFFALNRKNGIDDVHIEPYEKAIEAKAHGANGRARMTLRNRLAAIGRKNGGKLLDLDGNEHVIDIPAPPRSGAAAKAAEDK